MGENLNFECETGNSNPKALIQWVVDGRTLHDNYTHWVCTKTYFNINAKVHNITFCIDYQQIYTPFPMKCFLFIST